GALISPVPLRRSCASEPEPSKVPRPEAVALRSPPKGGQTRTGRPRWGLLLLSKPRWGCCTLGKPRWGLAYGFRLLEQLTLLSVPALLRTDVLPHRLLVPTDGADPVPRRPEMQPRHAAWLEQLAVDTHRTLTFQEAHRVRHAVLRWDAQTQVDVVGHGMP